MQKGDFIKITYTGRIKGTNELFDTTDEALARKENAFNRNAKYGPMPVITGEKRVIAGLDDALLAMSVSEKKTVEVAPDKAFGQRDAKMIKLFPATQFRSQNIEPYPGMLVTMNNALGKVMSVSSGRIRVDFNHPLAGKTLVYDLQVVEKIESHDGKAKAIIDFYVGDGKAKIHGEEAVLNVDAGKDAKEAISKEIMKYIPEVKKVRFEEVFENVDIAAKK
ncbi:MAG: FKBP-type peptidyl-prolyl cis-trans isomerase [Candidatus Aenigmarchaeota archaeon]|nr:FKBP-type peptidyl-prolyl cis-trans isomerase [Candidatus Aenigmarchaeota archaeon]